ncbi:YcxB family protein [Alteromonas sp. ASW11-130]|uniref:YcxB family protein n=1 Tax=Alteromonas sp. ASW11-130 TaxID=3015775 RepID=UPI002241F0E8|nr:YcxB family protein [Alteromonas sp. ASW11-130]MCW8092709.1 YcxB family protein [Alteromonas sp. ASW11-130]
MPTPFSYTTKYKLDRSHFAETFDESFVEQNFMQRYFKAIVLLLIGAAMLLFTEITAYLSWFFVALGALEAVSVRFRRPWWLTRQMMSRAANSELSLTIDEEGLKTTSAYVEYVIHWPDVTRIDSTTKGFVIHHQKGRTYLSNRCLSAAAQQFISNLAVTQ